MDDTHRFIQNNFDSYVKRSITVKKGNIPDQTVDMDISHEKQKSINCFGNGSTSLKPNMVET